MNRSKKQVFESMWIDIGLRRPPDTDHPNILGWNEKTQRPVLTSGQILNCQHDQLQSGKIVLESMEPTMYRTGYFVTQWMFVHGPKEDQ